jgi:hypothetical protein
MSTVDKGLEKALDTMRDVISASMMTHHSSGAEGTFSFSTWVTCNLCNHTGESDIELGHDSSCPIGHITDLFDDIEYPHLKKENQS